MQSYKTVKKAKKKKNRRRLMRDVLQPPEKGILFLKDKKGDGKTLLVNVHNMSEAGVLLESPQKFKIRSLLNLRIWHPRKKLWVSAKGKVKWTKNYPFNPEHYSLGIEFTENMTPEVVSIPSSSLHKKGIQLHDLEFLLRTKIFKALPLEAITPLLRNMKIKHYKAGERLIKQGDAGTHLFFILDGSCSVVLEKNGMRYNLNNLTAGDILGEIAVFTGEDRSAHVYADSDMDLLSISRNQLEALSKKYPDIRDFLSEMVTHRLSNPKGTADRRIGKYTINEMIDEGGFGVVYKGRHDNLNMPVAIKMLRHNMAMDSDFIEIFRNEAKIIARLNHGNIIRVYDIEELYKTMFIITEYLGGCPLRSILKSTPKLPLEKVLDITIQVCFGLEYAHKHGIIHQDINPNNIFIQSDGQVKIIDFGLATPTGKLDDNVLFPGTIFYIAPEQIEGNAVDERTDIYALGITVFEMLTGKRPFPEDNTNDLINLHLNEDFTTLHKKISKIPDELHNFFMKTIRKNPADRYSHISDILHYLLPLAEKFNVKAKSILRKQNQMKGVFLMYPDDNQIEFGRFIDEFNKNVSQTGGTLRVIKLEDLLLS